MINKYQVTAVYNGYRHQDHVFAEDADLAANVYGRYHVHNYKIPHKSMALRVALPDGIDKHYTGYVNADGRFCTVPCNQDTYLSYC